VRVVAGPTNIEFPPGIEVTNVTTARQMLDASQDFWPDTDIGCLTAAVCDFRPLLPDSVDPARKLKKRDMASGEFSLRLVENPDILRTLGEQKRSDQILIGFAAETEDLAGQARLKLAEKNLDLIVANLVGVAGSGFDSDTNTVTVLDRTGRMEQWPELPKTEVAWRVWDLLRHL
ncbi:MAG: phosphopantothenoylcysteine decarboxylase, partial [Humidesulfovibrio sp.]|nr:phosphopantothenoylcysteine decarboxylase [Humidesulfovibrio sp.]